jgi:hypothetical protein
MEGTKELKNERNYETKERMPQNSPKIKMGLELCAHNPILISSQFDSMTPNFTNGVMSTAPTPFQFGGHSGWG